MDQAEAQLYVSHEAGQEAKQKWQQKQQILPVMQQPGSRWIAGTIG